MNKKLYLPLAMASVLAMSSCSKKMGEMSSNNFNLAPQPLSAEARKVTATIHGNFPEKYFDKKYEVTVTT